MKKRYICGLLMERQEVGPAYQRRYEGLTIKVTSAKSAPFPQFILRT